MSPTSKIAVDARLAPYVDEILLEDPAIGLPAPPAVYKVLPQPRPVLGFQYRGRLAVVNGSGDELLGRCGITGVQSTFRCFRPDADTRTLLVVLRPYGAFALFGYAMNELADSHAALCELGPARLARTVEDRLADAGAPATLAEAVQSYLLDLVARTARQPHPAVVEASRRILAVHGSEPIDRLARDVAISRRQLERLFQLQIGVGPKQLASLARFDWAVARAARRESWAALAHDAGYADQPHFIRSFTRRAGVPPSDYFPPPPR